MIDGATAINLMRMELNMLPVHKGSRQGSQYAIRCPFCGDSRKSHHPHLYIKLAPDNRDGIPLFPYDCKLCQKGKSRVMTLYAAEKIGIRNAELLEYIGSIQKIKENSIVSSGTNVIAKKLTVSIPDTTDVGIQRKLDYLYDRLQDDDLVSDPSKYKIIIDLVSFFQKNQLQPNFDYPDPKRLLRTMHNCCVGFISFDNTHINFRDITNTLENRYTQYMIYSESKLKQKDLIAETSGIYFIPNRINTMAYPLRLVMAEGSFDILRTYGDFYGHDSSYGLFASVSNSHGYIPCITKLLEYGMMFDSIEIYSDDDVDLGFYKKFVRPMVPLADIKVYYNQLSKDVGNKRDPCKLSRVTI